MRAATVLADRYFVIRVPFEGVQIVVVGDNMVARDCTALKRYLDLADVAETWKAERTFTPKMDAQTRESRLAGWDKYVQKLLA